MVWLELSEIGAGEKLTAPELVEVAVDTVETLFFAGVLAGFGRTTGLITGLDTVFATGFWRASGTPFFIDVNSDLAGVGGVLGAALGIAGFLAGGAFEVGAFGAGALAAGALEVTATARVLATD